MVETNAFAGHAKCPTDRELESVLGQTHRLWKQLVDDLSRDLGLDTAEWHSSSIKLGWSLRLQLKKRNIVYLGPRQGSFLAAFVLGDKAVAAAKKSDLPARVKKEIAGARRYAEGTAVRIRVDSAEDLPTVNTLARIKVEN